MIKITNLEKSYFYGKGKEEKVLKGISAEFKSGQVNIIFGPSGCGKSTLLNIISGLDTKYTGSVEFAGQDIRNINLDNYRKDGIGFIFQNFNLIPNYNVLENVLVNLKLSKISKSDSENLGIEALDKLGMKAYAKKKPSELSGGQRQRVAIARAIVANPEVIVADEPTGALDTKTAAEVKDILVKLAKEENKTVIIVTHDRDFTKIADNVISMQDGKVVENVASDIKSTNNEVTLTKNKYGFLKTISNSFKSLFSRKLRTILLILATSIGLIGILSARSLGNGINESVNSIFAGLDPKKITIQPKETNDEYLDNNQVSEIKSELSKKSITKVDEISQFTSISDELYNKTTEFLEEQGTTDQVASQFAGKAPVVSTTDEQLSEFKVGTTLHAKLEQKLDYEFLISEDIASNLLKNSAPTKEQYQSLLGKDYTFEYKYNDKKTLNTYKITGVIDSTSTTIIRTNKSIVDKVFKDVEQVETVSYIEAFASSEEEANNISTELKKNTVFSEKYSSSTTKDQLGQITSVTSIITIILTAAAALSLIVATFMISIMLFTSVTERTREIGLRRAVGYRKKDIRRGFIYEAFIIGWISLAFSIVISLIINAVVNQISQKQIQIDAMKLLPVDIVIVAIIITIITLFASLFPAFRAAKLDPAESLRYE